MKKIVLGVAALMCMQAATALWAQGTTAGVQASAATQQAQQAAAAVQAPKPKENPFPAVDPRNFTTDTPTREEVDSFLKTLWGFDANRVWQVAAIQKTTAPGVARVVVFVDDIGANSRAHETVFYTTPDGKHAIADGVIDFGAKPFEATRATLQQQADGPAKGAAGKDLLFVEFVDLQDPRTKTAQDTMNSLQQDFPQARIVVQPRPMETVHPFAMRAALYGECVREQKGDAGYFQYQQAVLDKQAGLTIAGAETTLLTAAASTGADAKLLATCVDSTKAKDAVEASEKLADSVGATSAPLLMVNGHPFSPTNIPYQSLRKMVAYQANLDGLSIHLQPLLTDLK